MPAANAAPALAVLDAIYNPTTLTFLTASGSSVKVWDARSGELTHVFRGLLPSDITSVCLDDRERKLIVGDHQGNIRVRAARWITARACALPLTQPPAPHAMRCAGV